MYAFEKYDGIIPSHRTYIASYVRKYVLFMYGFYRTRDKVEMPIMYVFFSLRLLRNVIYIFLLWRVVCTGGERRRYNSITQSKAPPATTNVVNNSRTERVSFSRPTGISVVRARC